MGGGLIFGLIACVIFSYAAGRYIGSKAGGLVIVSALPIALALFGLIAYLDATDSASSMEEAFAGIYLAIPIFAAVLEGIALIAWGVGRNGRHETAKPQTTKRRK